MAHRRMFANTVLGSDQFVSMPFVLQALYIHLNIGADDDGFIDNAVAISRTINCNIKNLSILVENGFLLFFEKEKIYVIKDWHISNQIRKDRYKETRYLELKSQLTINNGSYSFNFEQENIANNNIEKIVAIERNDNEIKEEVKQTASATILKPYGNQMATQISIGKDSLGKDSLGKVSKSTMINHDQPAVEKPSGNEYVASLIQRLYDKEFLKSPQDKADEYRYAELFEKVLKAYGIKNVNQSLNYVLTFASYPETIENKYGWLHVALHDNCEKYANKNL
jgi:hypothetical protein